MARLLSGRSGDPNIGFDDAAPDTPLLSLREWVALARAPRHRGGADVTVRAIPVGITGNQADHMYAEYDDGLHQYIYRGGPRGLALHARLDPATRSPDYNSGGRVIFHTFLADKTAEEAIKPAQRDADRINRVGPPYGGLSSNSNTLIGDFTAAQFGKRVGDGRTWGYHGGLIDPGPDVYPVTLPIW